MIAKDCVECGKSFEVDDSKRNWNHVKLCSSECQRQVTNRKVRESYTPQEWPQKGICAWCGSGFLKKGPGQKKKLYCDRKCRTKELRHERDVARAKSPLKVCPVCGKDFRPHKLAPKKQIYCSHKCYVREQYRRHSYRKENRKDQVGFRTVKPIVLERDGEKCTLCGSTDNLHVHHFDNSGNSDHPNNDPTNLTTLCRGCHNGFHRVNLVKIDGEWFVSGPALINFSGEYIRIFR